MRTYVRMVACVHLPRFELPGGGRRGLPGGFARRSAGVPLAVAPPWPAASAPRGATGVGEVSQAAEAMGVRRGMALGEALARCPELVLLPADPVRVAERWEEALEALEAIGAAVEPARPGLAYFEADGLRALHGTLAATLAGRRARSPTRCGSVRPRRASAPSRARWRPARGGRWCWRASTPGAGWPRGRLSCSATGSRPRRCRSRCPGLGCGRSGS